MAQPFAVFDIDGTLIRWQLYHALADALVKRGIVDNEQYQAVLQARMDWKTRQSSNSFGNYERSLIKLIEQAIIGVDYDIFQGVCQDVVNRYRDQVYTFTRDLIDQLRRQGYLIFGLSASPAELVSLIAEYYHFDNYGASVYEVIDGKLTGKHQLLYGPAKPALLRKLIKTHQASLEGSIGVGDSEGDIDMLELVERSIAFNPTRRLFEWAQSNNCEMVIERKNVVYRLKYDHGTYVLATTV